MLNFELRFIMLAKWKFFKNLIFEVICWILKHRLSTKHKFRHQLKHCFIVLLGFLVMSMERNIFLNSFLHMISAVVMKNKWLSKWLSMLGNKAFTNKAEITENFWVLLKNIISNLLGGDTIYQVRLFQESTERPSKIIFHPNKILNFNSIV